MNEVDVTTRLRKKRVLEPEHSKKPKLGFKAKQSLLQTERRT